MGIDISQAVALGFNVPEKEMQRVVGVHVPEVVREEPRFDAKTGQPIAPERIVERRSRWTYRVDGKDYEGLSDAAEAVARKLGCDAHEYGCWITGIHNFVFGVPTGLYCGDAGRCPEDSSIPLKTLLQSVPVLEDIGAKLREMGFNVGEPQLMNVWLSS